MIWGLLSHYFNNYRTMETLVVIAKGKIHDCVDRALDGLCAGKQIAILGKSDSLTKAISIAEITKRNLEENQHEVIQQSRIYRKQFGEKVCNCIEIKLIV